MQANYADIVSNEFISKICPKEYNELIYSFGENINLESFYWLLIEINEPIEYNLSFDDYNKIKSLYKILQNKFMKITNLELSLDCHISENHDDEVDGVFWKVEGVWELSKSGKKYRDEIRRVHYVFN